MSRTSINGNALPNNRTSINGTAINNRTSINGSQKGSQLLSGGRGASFQRGRSGKDFQSGTEVVKNNVFDFNVTVKVENKKDGKTTTICDNVTASVKSGNMVAIIGPSGAGNMSRELSFVTYQLSVM